MSSVLLAQGLALFAKAQLSLHLVGEVLIAAMDEAQVIYSERVFTTHDGVTIDDGFVVATS